jgi:hypothetical protein
LFKDIDGIKGWYVEKHGRRFYDPQFFNAKFEYHLFIITRNWAVPEESPKELAELTGKEEIVKVDFQAAYFYEDNLDDITRHRTTAVKKGSTLIFTSSLSGVA